jgi:coenzyme PQQ precursor peptide PqqA
LCVSRRLRSAETQLTLCGHDWSPVTHLKRNAMAWSTPTLVEICIGLEINGYLPPEF